MNRQEYIERFRHNAEYERTHGNLQGCLEFREIANELEKLEKIEQIYNDRLGKPISHTLSEICDVLKSEDNK